MTDKKDEALKLALEALKQIDEAMPFPVAKLAQKAIREALAEQPVQVDPCIDGSCSCCWTHLDEQPAQQQEPWPEEPARHTAGGVQPSKQTQVAWTERWYGSLAEKGWWICCGREHIAHLGTEVSSNEVRKIVDAHNSYKPAAQQQEPVQTVPREWRSALQKLAFMARTSGGTAGRDSGLVEAIETAEALLSLPYLYTSPQPAQRKPWVGLTDEEFHRIYDNGKTPAGMMELVESALREKNSQPYKPLTEEQITECWEQMGRGLDKYTAFARAIEAAHGIKGDA